MNNFKHNTYWIYCRAAIVVVMLCFACLPSTFAQEPIAADSIKPLALPADTVADVAQDSVTNLVQDSLPNNIDTVATAKTDSITPKKKSETTLDDKVEYSANDSIVFFANGVAILYGEGDITYTKMNLKSEIIRIVMDSSTIHAYGTVDSLGNKVGEPVFTESDHSYNARELTYNLKTKKGYIRQAVTQEGEGYIVSDRTKKSNDDELCMQGGKYTVCDNHDHPHFYMNITKGKVKPGKQIVVGPSYLVVEDVPLPLAVPFGFFPFTQDYSSGVLMPSFVDELNRGFGLTNGGYYFAISDYVDVEARGDIYSKGTWAVRANSTYLKKYKFRGSLGIEYRADVTGEKDLNNYVSNPSLSINWTHSQDPKASPNTKLSASVSFRTNGFNQNNINNYSRPEINSQASTSSSVSLTQTFPSIPSLNLSLNASINQNMRDSTLNLSLPSLQISYSRFYPFKRKRAVGNERWYEKISMSYSGQLSNSIYTKESELLKSSLQRDWKNGMKHSIPVSATFNLLKYINISPYFNYNERWSLQTTRRDWDREAQREIVTDTVYKFARSYDFSMGVSATTKLYGFYVPWRALFGNKIDRIRHVLTPSIGFSYTPDFGDPRFGSYGSYIQYLRDRENPDLYYENEVRYSYFTGSQYGSAGQGTSGSVNFSLGNNLEMKVRNDKDTTGTEPFKRVSLIDNLSLSSSYNMAADSMNLSPISANIRIKITKSYSLSLATTFDPYMYGLNSSGRPVKINQFRWSHGKFPKFMGTSTSQSININNETVKKWFTKKTPAATPTDASENSDELDSESTVSKNDSKKDNKAKADSDGYEKLEMPWNISVSYSVNYGIGSDFDYTKMDYKMQFTHNLSMSGSLSLTGNWKLSANTSYDFKAKQFAYTGINVSRSLHCWSMSASIVPFGRYKSYSFHIGVNSSMLSDLKYDQQSAYGGSPITWY
ncbi:MAG: LPS-assembly protein LptD [Paludibacter sp.]|jgi:hypothetical protein|nr:LPS-assembly protein LptD [Paludibacter sp.]